MYYFILTRKFLQNQEEYVLKITKKEINIFFKLKKIFKENIFDERLKTHKIYEKGNIKVFSSYINWKDRIIFFYKDSKKVYLYKIMKNHDYKKLLSNIDFALKDFLDNRLVWV